MTQTQKHFVAVTRALKNLRPVDKMEKEIGINLEKIGREVNPTPAEKAIQEYIAAQERLVEIRKESNDLLEKIIETKREIIELYKSL